MVRCRALFPRLNAIALVCSNYDPSLFISNPYANQCVDGGDVGYRGSCADGKGTFRASMVVFLLVV